MACNHASKASNPERGREFDSPTIRPHASAVLTIQDDAFTVACDHGTRTIERTGDVNIPETDEFMIRYALQRHGDRCEVGCTVELWNSWFEKRRLRFEAEGNAKAHG